MKVNQKSMQKNPQNFSLHISTLFEESARLAILHSDILRLSQFPIFSCVHNWMIKYLDSRKHCTKYNSNLFTFLQTNARFVQGSRIWPTEYVCNASVLLAFFPGNGLNKYADDTYLVVPSSNSHTCFT